MSEIDLDKVFQAIFIAAAQVELAEEIEKVLNDENEDSRVVSSAVTLIALLTRKNIVSALIAGGATYLALYFVDNKRIKARKNRLSRFMLLKFQEDLERLTREMNSDDISEWVRNSNKEIKRELSNWLQIERK